MKSLLNKLTILVLILFFYGCEQEPNKELIGKYKTEYAIYYGNYVKTYIKYSNKEIYSCSFQGTNFLLEKDNSEEILSTTAPIEILSSEIIK